jgi:hypothetical protein
VPQPCVCCHHPRRADIDYALKAGESYRRVGEHYGIGREAAHRHARAHLGNRDTTPVVNRDSDLNRDTLDQVNRDSLVAVQRTVTVPVGRTVTAAADGTLDTDPPPGKPCTICRCSSYWQRPPSNGGGWVCSRCHPYFGVEPVQVVTVTSSTR